MNISSAALGGHLVRTIGLERAKVKIGLMNRAYNRQRWVQLTALDTRRQVRLALGQHEIGLPATV